jgi:nucleoside-diphosphate kinase
MIKPDAVEKGSIGAILKKINEAGFRIVAMKLTHMSPKKAKAFYAVHSERPFFEKLIAFMTRGPIVAAVLERENAVKAYRALIGATNPEEAAEGTLRKEFAASMTENAIHGADSDENAALETEFHFRKEEIF